MKGFCFCRERTVMNELKMYLISNQFYGDTCASFLCCAFSDKRNYHDNREKSIFILNK